jgi:formate--tetrahydrofolate ligase
MASDLAIARATHLRPIQEIAARLGIPAEAVLPYGRHKAKIEHAFLREAATRAARGRLVLVTGITPTPAGEGKTTTTIGLTDALNASGARAVACLREPSLGPCFGVKGGATGGGRAQVAPMDEINLHFTGDFHAVTSAHALLSAMLDNHLHWGNALDLDPRRLVWRRAVDMNDRALRSIAVGFGGAAANGPGREDGFDITVASEVMAILCLAADLPDLHARLGRIVVGRRRDGTMVTARDLQADGAMAALLRDAMMPNLVQTLEGSPALVHGGPFANIAHGCSSVAGTKLGLATADFVVTEAGFGADLGAEKFCDIKCRVAGLAPACAVVVATVRALKMHGGVARAALGRPDVAAVTAGLVNLRRHVENMRRFGLPVVVALNRFDSDHTDETQAVVAGMAGTTVVPCSHWADGAAGAAGLAAEVRRRIDAGEADFRMLYDDALTLPQKVERIATDIYRGRAVAIAPAARRKLDAYEAEGFGGLPVCIAKTPYSFSADPGLGGTPDDHVLPIRDVRLSAGAGFVVALAGDVLTMPGLPRHPAAEHISLGPDGEVSGLD